RSRSPAAPSTTPTPPTSAGSTSCGGCTRGWTVRHAAATRPVSGGAATTSTTPSDAGRPARAGRRCPQPGPAAGTGRGPNPWHTGGGAGEGDTPGEGGRV